MPALARVIPWLVLAFALIALLLGIYEMSHPPFTDEQIKASLADTFEVATSTTRVFGVVFLGLGAICVVLARKAASGTAQIVAWLAALACLATLLVFMWNQALLAERAARLTGQESGALWGLF